MSIMAISSVDPMIEIKNLCEEIKRLVPTNKPKDPTGPFNIFIKNLEKDVDKHEIDAIHRSYNYFNCLIAMTPDKAPLAPVSVTEVSPLAQGTPLDQNTQREMIEILLGLVSKG